MGKPTGFLEIERVDPEKSEVAERVGHFREFERRLPILEAADQGARCMSCGVPFCHTGCPLGNRIPEWNDHVYRDRWDRALATLHATNNFPEITGRICPAPCEEACVVSLRGEPVSIKAIERTIADRAIEAGHVRPQIADRRTGRRVAVVGSGPAGLACAQQLARAGHEVTVLERADRIGGLLRYGIPDFKLEKQGIDLRMEQMRAEGVAFRTGVEVGADVSIEALRATNDAVVIATGSTKPRDLKIPGRELAGVHFAMDFLTEQNRVVAGDEVKGQILATARKVVILGGGDTGSDCLGTSHRQGATGVMQIELMPRAPERSGPGLPSWPMWPWVFRTSSSQEEGGVREFAIATKRFLADASGRVRAIEVVEVSCSDDRRTMTEIEGTEHEIECDLVLLALGFTGPEDRAIEGLPIAKDERGNVRADATSFGSSVPGVFACGDARRGQSLVVWAIWEGRQTARAVDVYLMGESWLPSMPYVGAV